MQTNYRIANNIAIERFDEDPYKYFPKEFTWIQVDDTEVALGDVYENGSWRSPGWRDVYESESIYRAEILMKVSMAIEGYRNQLVQNASTSEQAAWSRKAAAWARYEQGILSTSDKVLLDTEIATRDLGETREDLVKIWGAKDLQLMQGLGYLDGMINVTLNVLDQTDTDDLESVVIQLQVRANELLESLA